MTNYIYKINDNYIEVKTTGRYVDKSSDFSDNIHVRLLEIEPIESLGWKKFVDQKKLYAISYFDNSSENNIDSKLTS